MTMRKFLTMRVQILLINSISTWKKGMSMNKTRIIERRCLLKFWDLMDMDVFVCMGQVLLHLKCLVKVQEFLNINENSIREELERQYQSQLDDLKSHYESKPGDLQSKYEDLSSQIHLMKAHVGFQANPTESESGQIPDASSLHQRRLSVSSEQQHQFDPEA
ncbi:unnamed protein product [Prunus brigantina]